MAEIIQQMMEAGAPPGAIVVAVNAIESFRNLPETSGKVTEYEVAIWRKVERERKQQKPRKARKTKGIAEANDAANTPKIDAENLPEPSGRNVSSCRTLTSLLPLKEALQGREVKVSGSARARGTRLPEDWQPTEADREFARDHGVDPDWLRDEFVDFWTNVPGQRALKLDWSKTWRTRIRAIAAKKTLSGGANGAGNRKDEWASVQQRAGEFGRGIRQDT